LNLDRPHKTSEELNRVYYLLFTDLISDLSEPQSWSDLSDFVRLPSDATRIEDKDLPDPDPHPSHTEPPDKVKYCHKTSGPQDLNEGRRTTGILKDRLGPARVKSDVHFSHISKQGVQKEE